MPSLAMSRPALLCGAGFCAAQVMWESPADWVEKFFTEELEAHVPREILSVKEVSREVNFSSVEKMVTLFVVALYSMYKKKYNRKFGDAFCCCFYSMYRMTMYAKKKSMCVFMPAR